MQTDSAPDTRQPIELPVDRPTGSALSAALLQNDLVKVAISCYLEGATLEGDWRPEISIRLVPV